MRPTLLAVSGSPRRDGNTEILLNEVAAGFTDGGGRVDLLPLRDYQIGYCRGCFSCLKQLIRPCAHRDAMDGLYDRILDANAIVLGTPVYFWGPTAQMKTFLDRWFPFGDYQTTGWARALRGKPAGIVMAYAENDPLTSGAELTYRQLEIVLKCTGAEVIGLVHAAANEPGDVRRAMEKLAAARNLGASLAERLQHEE